MTQSTSTRERANPGPAPQTSPTRARRRPSAWRRRRALMFVAPFLAVNLLGIPGLGETAILGSPSTALPAVSLINIWAFWGFVLVVCLAALQGVDKSLYEAARLDGANRWQQVRYVSIPAIRQVLVFIIVISVMFSVLAVY